MKRGLPGTSAQKGDCEKAGSLRFRLGNSRKCLQQTEDQLVRFRIHLGGMGTFPSHFRRSEGSHGQEMADGSTNRNGRTARGARARRGGPSANILWSDQELLESVNVYVLLLRMQIQGMTQKAEPVAHALLGGPLALRNDAAIRYRMRNVSAVAKELGAPTLYGFSPAESVGTNVRSRIRDMLQQHVDFDRILHPIPRSLDRDRADALAALALLKERIESLESELSWMGHNQPPEAASLDGPGRQELQEAHSTISDLEAELAKPELDDAKIQEDQSRLMKFVAALAGWLGARATRFVDAALKVAAPIVVIKATGLMPHAVSAVEAIARVLGR